MITVEDLAGQLGMDPEDIAVMASWLGADGDHLDRETVSELWDMNNHYCERTVSQLYGQAGEDV